MFNPLPAIALLPLALLWFGLGAGSLVFVPIHSVRLRLQLGFGRPGLVIYENKNQLEIANVFAGLLTVILIGLGGAR